MWGVDAGLADQAQPRKSPQQRRANLGALADQHQRLRVAQALGQRVDVLRVIVPHLELVLRSFAKQPSVRSVSWESSRMETFIGRPAVIQPAAGRARAGAPRPPQTPTRTRHRPAHDDA